jgi:hypothetical protein
MTDNGRDTVRIAAIGDLHCTKNSQPLQPIFLQASTQADVLVLCGDLTDYGTPEEAQLLVRELTSAKMPVVGVLGNHDFESGKADEVAKILAEGGVRVLDGDSCEFLGIGFAGVKGFCRLHQAMPEQEVPLQLVAPQVEVPVTEAELLRRELFALPSGHRNDRRVGRAEDAERRRFHLDAAGSELGVPHRLGALSDDSFDEHHRFGAKGRGHPGEVGRSRRQVDRHLYDAGAVAQVEEDETAKVARAMDPAPESHRRAHMLVSKGAAEMRPIGRR